VNGDIVPLRHKLESGDLVEIRTSPNQRPNKDWLDFCSTNRARSRIRAFLRSEHRQKSINLGRELLEADLRTAGMSLSKLLKNDAELRRVVLGVRYSSRDEMLLAIGYGKLPTERVIAAIRSREPQAPDPPREFRPSAIEQLVRRVTGKDQTGIRVAGEDDVLIRYAKCCNPLPGDPIVGFITRGRGATIHRRNCPKAFNGVDPARRIEVSWDTKAKITRPVQLRVVTTQSQGILAVVSQAFSEQKLNISEATCRAGEDGKSCNTFTFQVADISELRSLMAALSRIKGVVQVERI
jgi:GTP pyrophosphokinase